MSAIKPAANYQTEDGVAIITLNDLLGNPLSAATRDAIYALIETAIADEAVSSVVTIFAGRAFVACVDASSTKDADVQANADLLLILSRIGDCPKPVIMAIHATALDGSLEIVMCGHFRVAVPSARFGLPQVKVGLLPCAGGTQRLTRLVGAEAALDLLTTGDQIDSAQALNIGLIDAIVPEDQLREAALAFARKIVADNIPAKPISEREVKIIEDRKRPQLFDEYRKANAKRLKNLEAPEKIIQCVEAAIFSLSFDAGIAQERALMMSVNGSVQNRALLHSFLAARAAGKVKDIPAETATLPIERVGIIGAGTMGRGIALAFLNGGFSVTMFDMTYTVLEAAQKLMRRSYEGQLKRGQITKDEVDARLAKLTLVTALEGMADADLVIEAVFENMNTKKELFGKLNKIVKPTAILASNTSYLDINEMAAATSRPDAVIGMHFFSPANIMKLLEVVRGAKTSKETIATVMQLAGRISKVPVLAGVCFGFIGNRMLRRRRETVERLILEGAAPDRIDGVLERFGFPMGPFAMADMAGLDVGWSRQPKGGTTTKELLCEAGRFGQKNGMGYYEYDDNRMRSASPIALDIIVKLATDKGVPQRAFTDEEILAGLLYPSINEGAKILDEGIAQRSSDIDVTWINGYSFPAYRGGPMYWADQVGLDKVLAGMEELEVRYGHDFAPAPLLCKLVAEGRGFGSV